MSFYDTMPKVELHLHLERGGVRVVEDSVLVAYLVEHQIPLESCPASNLRTNVLESWDTHPVRALIAAGANVILNTDDPAMLNSTLAGEYARVETEFGPGETPCGNHPLTQLAPAAGELRSEPS